LSSICNPGTLRGEKQCSFGSKEVQREFLGEFDLWLDFNFK